MARTPEGPRRTTKDISPRIGFAYAPEKLFGLFPNTVLRGGYGIYYSALSYSDFGDSLTSGTSVTPDFRTQDNFGLGTAQPLDAGFPSFTQPSNAADPALLNGQFPNYVAPEYGRPGMVQNWSLEIQHELATDLILSVGTGGTRRHQPRAPPGSNPNHPPQTQDVLGGVKAEGILLLPLKAGNFAVLCTSQSQVGSVRCTAIASRSASRCGLSRSIRISARAPSKMSANRHTTLCKQNSNGASVTD